MDRIDAEELKKVAGVTELDGKRWKRFRAALTTTNIAITSTTLHRRKNCMIVWNITHRNNKERGTSLGLLTPATAGNGPDRSAACQKSHPQR